MAQSPGPATQPVASASLVMQANAAVAALPAGESGPTLRLSLAEALQRARANSPAFQAAVTNAGVARNLHTEARAALLPSLTLQDSYIWTQRNIFVANDGPHEFMTWAHARETLDFSAGASLRLATAGEALAQAQQQVAARGLDATVTAGYYNILAATHMVDNARQALHNAQQYLTYSQDRERHGSAAHADVIKAEVTVEQQQRALADAQVARQQARLQLAVLLFPSFNTSYTLVDDLDAPPPLPTQARVEALAGRHNPQLAAAEAQFRQAHASVSVARGSLLPSVSLDYWFGIDAHEFALKNQFGERNLGNSVAGTLSIPVFDWGGNRARLRAAHLQEKQAQRELSAAQRQLLADLQSDYAEAQVAHEDLLTLQHSQSLAAESLRLTALQYKDGAATILALVDAQDTLAAANNAYATGEVRYRTALAQLQTLTGTF